MPKLPSKPVTIPVRAGQRIAHPAGSDHHCICRETFSALQPHPADRAILLQNLYRADLLQKLCVAAEPFERFDNIHRLVRNRKYPVPPLGFERHSERFEQLHGILCRKRMESAVEKPRIGVHMPDQLFGGAVVGDIAPALSGDLKFTPRTSVFIEQRDLCAGHPGRSCPYDNRFTAHPDPPRGSQRPRILPISVPTARRYGKLPPAFSARPPRSVH